MKLKLLRVDTKVIMGSFFLVLSSLLASPYLKGFNRWEFY
ncbi:Uncharacterised protein [Streptococcus pneumoniae]|nr:Uncharacterised protein [Streptococcus pneumoniae]